MRAGEELECTQPRLFFVGAVQPRAPLPHRRLDDGEWDFAERDCRFERADSAAVLKPTGDSLPRQDASALDHGVIGMVMSHPVCDGQRVDSHLGFNASDRDVDGGDKLRCSTVVDLDNCEAAGESGVYAENFHAPSRSTHRSWSGPGFVRPITSKQKS